MENVAVGGVSAYMNHLLLNNPQITEAELVRSTRQFIDEESKQKRNAFQVCYSLILGHHANEHERQILERMGTIQIHHGSAGSSMVARYMATLHTFSVADFFIASQMALDGARHFGAIHDMSDFVQELEPLTPEQRGERIQGEDVDWWIADVWSSGDRGSRQRQSGATGSAARDLYRSGVQGDRCGAVEYFATAA